MCNLLSKFVLPKITILLKNATETRNELDKKGRLTRIETNAGEFSIILKRIITVGSNKCSCYTSYEFPSRLKIMLNRKIVCDQKVSNFTLKCYKKKILIYITPSPRSKPSKIPQ